MEDKKETLPEEEACETTGGVGSKPEEVDASEEWQSSNRPIERLREGLTPEEEKTKEEERVRRLLEEARRGCEEISDEELHPDYKKLIATGSAPSVPTLRDEGEKGERNEVIHYAKCGECGVELPYDQLYDNGNYLVCSKCI